MSPGRRFRGTVGAAFGPAPGYAEAVQEGGGGLEGFRFLGNVNISDRIESERLCVDYIEYVHPCTLASGFGYVDLLRLRYVWRVYSVFKSILVRTIFRQR